MIKNQSIVLPFKKLNTKFDIRNQILPIFALPFSGEMPERSNGAVSKTVDPRKEVPGFESLSLRQNPKENAILFRVF